MNQEHVLKQEWKGGTKQGSESYGEYLFAVGKNQILRESIGAKGVLFTYQIEIL